MLKQNASTCISKYNLKNSISLQIATLRKFIGIYWADCLVIGFFMYEEKTKCATILGKHSKVALLNISVYRKAIAKSAADTDSVADSERSA